MPKRQICDAFGFWEETEEEEEKDNKEETETTTICSYIYIQRPLRSVDVSAGGDVIRLQEGRQWRSQTDTHMDITDLRQNLTKG